MALNKELINDIITVTSKAAISCYNFIGKNQKKNADKAATDSMRDEINKLLINGEVVIGEGELDKAPMLYIGEKLGSGGNLNLDIERDLEWSGNHFFTEWLKSKCAWWGLETSEK